MGNVGIPMGLTVAPQLARLTTAYKLTTFKLPHPKAAFTLYYDDVAATLPINDQKVSNIQALLCSYKLTMTEDNRTQDRQYNLATKESSPFIQQFRNPTIIHPDFNHPNPQMIAKSYFSSIFRCAKIGTQPSTTLSHIIRGYLPLLMQLGHDPNHTLTNMIEPPTTTTTTTTPKITTQ